jgi:prophage antirepressor-like protein
MQNIIKNFDFNGHGVRIITNEDGHIYFVAKDVCEVLGYTKSTSAVIDTHCKSEGCTKMVLPTNQGDQEQIIINEGNLYRLVLKSRKNEASVFESWVCDEVLPSIRKTGKYESKPLSPAEQLLANAQLLVDLERKQNEFDNRLKAIEETRNKATQELLETERSTEKIPEETTRVKIRRIINQYCNSKNADHRSVWHVIYDRLYYRYGVNLRAIVKKKGEATLDVAERLGHLDKIYAICSSELV